MSKNEQQDNEQDNVIILSSYIDTNQAHDLLFKWIEKQNSENYVRDHFFVKEMQKKYYGCIGFWFKTKALNPEKATNIVIIVPGSNKVPEAITELSKYYDYNKFEETKKEYTPITITDDDAEPKAYELLKKQYPSLFDEFGKLNPNTEIAGACSVAIPVWEGTYNSKYGKEHKFYIDAQTGETTGDLYNDKSKANKKPTKRLTPKEIKELGKTDISLGTIPSTNKKEETTSKKDKINEKAKESKKEIEDNDEDEDIDENESHRYIIIFLIVVAIGILLFIGSKILKPNHDPNTPTPQNTSITAQQKPKYIPPPKEKIDKNKLEREKPENFADSIIKKLVSQKYKEINELISKNPDEYAEIEGYTNVTSTFENIGELESYYSKTTSIFPEKTTKIFSQSTSNDNVDNTSDGSAIPNVIKEQAKEENNLVSVYTSYIETYNETDSIGNSSEKKDRTILIFTFSTEDNKTKIKSVHRKYEQVDEEAISQIKEKESNAYSEISQNKSDESKKEEKVEEKTKEENKNNETSYQQPKQEVESQTTNKKPQINLIPEGSTYVENEPQKPKQEKKNIEEVETSTTSTTQQTNSSSNVYSSSEGSESGSAGGSVQ